MPLRIGLYGSGAFAEFLARTLKRSDAVAIVAVASRRPERAQAFARDEEIARAFASFDAMLEGDEIDAIIIATPPEDHAPRATRALEAGKHVLVEKPLATTLPDGENVLAAAERGKKIITIDYPMPHTQVVQAIAAIATSGAAGKLRRIAVENIASCEALPDDHWFWDLTLSGGIFVEHGVHFFDWCGSLLDAPESVIAWSAQSGRRQDRVFAAVSHAGGALATYYHAFIAKSEDERTHVSLAFDSCDVVVDGWIPIRMTLRGAKAQDAADAVRKMHRSMLRESAGPDDVVFDAGPKQAAYAAGVSSVAADFAQAVASPSHRMLVDGKRALSSLRVAVAARESAQQHRRVSL